MRESYSAHQKAAAIGGFLIVLSFSLGSLFFASVEAAKETVGKVTAPKVLECGVQYVPVAASNRYRPNFDDQTLSFSKPKKGPQGKAVIRSSQPKAEIQLRDRHLQVQVSFKETKPSRQGSTVIRVSKNKQKKTNGKKRWDGVHKYPNIRYKLPYRFGSPLLYLDLDGVRTTAQLRCSLKKAKRLN